MWIWIVKQQSLLVTYWKKVWSINNGVEINSNLSNMFRQLTHLPTFRDLLLTHRVHRPIQMSVLSGSTGRLPFFLASTGNQNSGCRLFRVLIQTTISFWVVQIYHLKIILNTFFMSLRKYYINYTKDNILLHNKNNFKYCTLYTHLSR